MTRYRCRACGRDQYTTRTDAENEPCIYCGEPAIEKMINLSGCVCCGSEIPEGRQVCPKCESEAKDMKNPYFNSEGYADPTAYEALKPIVQADAALEGKLNFLIKVIKFIANEAGFDITNRIELRDRKTGRLFK